MLIDGIPVFEKQYDNSLPSVVEALGTRDKPDGYLGDATVVQILFVKLLDTEREHNR